MVPEGATVVRRHEFLKFFVGLQGICAEDQPDLSPVREGASPAEVSIFNLDASSRLLPTTKSSRRHPGFASQLFVLLKRELVQWWRKNNERLPFLGVVIFAALVLSLMDRFVCHVETWSAQPYLNLHTSHALLSAVFSLRLFSADRPVFWRESASGIRVLAFFLARVLLNGLDLLLQCFLLFALYYLIAQPAIDFGLAMVPCLLVTFVASGIGYLTSALAPPEHGPFIVAIFCFVSCGLLGHPLKVGLMEENYVMELTMDFTSITRWSVGMAFLNGLEEMQPIPKSLRHQQEINVLKKTYLTRPHLQDWLGYRYTGMAFLLGAGLICHAAAYLALRCMHRDKQV